MVSSTRRTAGCGPACPVVWQGRVGDHFPYADWEKSLVRVELFVASPFVFLNLFNREIQR
jgi:hypothetical protein